MKKLLLLVVGLLVIAENTYTDTIGISQYAETNNQKFVMSTISNTIVYEYYNKDKVVNNLYQNEPKQQRLMKFLKNTICDNNDKKSYIIIFHTSSLKKAVSFQINSCNN